LTKSSLVRIEISYDDIQESQNNDTEKKIVKREKEEKALIKDAHKF